MQEFIQGQGQPQEQAQAQQPQAEMIPQGQEMPQELPHGTGLAEIEQNPAETPDEEASAEDQAQYDDLFLRAMAAVNDIRKPPKAKKSMADQVIQTLADKGQEPQQSIGRTAGLLLFQLTTMAKRQKVEYSPDVVREVGMDLVQELYKIADASGAIKNLPPVDSKDGEELLTHATLEAVKMYGEQAINTGQVNQQEHMNELEHQMQREADSGELDDWGMEEFDPQTRLDLARKVGDVTRGT